MEKTHETLVIMLKNKMFNLESFYTFNLRQGKITLQGNFDKDTIAQFTAIDGLKRDVRDNGYIELSFNYLGVEVEVVLT